MFYPFQMLEDLKSGGSYWKKFEGQLRMYSEEQKTAEEKGGKKESNMKLTHTYKFWSKGFEILQNFQYRFTLEKRSDEQGVPFFYRQHFNNQILGTQRIQKTVQRNHLFLT